ncbi:MAG TPA: hypothetical protein VN578_03845 [Candidatus Binatia bacterium]|jgi:anti-anti-sigma regulatory factor|nr:hypothetical protein [Candidatus Binatia bacterium]
MFEAKIDKSANLLTVSFSGNVDPGETKRLAAEVERLAAELPPGFRLLTDLTSLEAMDLACVPHIRRVMDLCNKQGIAMVVRVIPDPHKDIGFNILSLFHYRRGVRIVTCETLSEARKILSG